MIRNNVQRRSAFQTSRGPVKRRKALGSLGLGKERQDWLVAFSSPFPKLAGWRGPFGLSLPKAQLIVSTVVHVTVYHVPNV